MLVNSTPYRNDSRFFRESYRTRPHLSAAEYLPLDNTRGDARPSDSSTVPLSWGIVEVWVAAVGPDLAFFPPLEEHSFAVGTPTNESMAAFLPPPLAMTQTPPSVVLPVPPSALLMS